MLNTVEEKINKVKDILKRFNRVVVAFSGGIDSTLVLALALKTCKHVIAATVYLPYIPLRHINRAKLIASELKVKHIIINEPKLPDEILYNPPNRCYLCKKKMIKLIKNTTNTDIIIDGTNADDYKEYRPGLKALEEENVVSPLALAGMTKNDIKYSLKILGLDKWDAPPTTCLLTRIPYGDLVTYSRLKKIEKAEEIIINTTSIKHVRVRDHGDLARIEVPKEKFEILLNPLVSSTIVSELKKLGYRFITLDLEGYKRSSAPVSLE